MRAADEIVIDDDLADVFGCELVDGMRADQPSPTDDDDPLSSQIHCLTSSSNDPPKGRPISQAAALRVKRHPGLAMVAALPGR